VTDLKGGCAHAAAFGALGGADERGSVAADRGRAGGERGAATFVQATLVQLTPGGRLPVSEYEAIRHSPSVERPAA
jgi:hypothetical protein